MCNIKTRTAAIAGIFYFMISFAITSYFFTNDIVYKNTMFDAHPILATANLAEFILYTIFILGFVAIGKMYHNKTIITTSYLSIAASAIYMIYDLFSGYFAFLNTYYFELAIIISMGVISIIFGYALMQIKDLGNLAKAAGILNVIIGLSFVSVVFSFIGLMLIFPGQIVEIILMYNAPEKTIAEKAKKTVAKKKAKRKK